MHANFPSASTEQPAAKWFPCRDKKCLPTNSRAITALCKCTTSVKRNCVLHILSCFQPGVKPTGCSDDKETKDSTERHENRNLVDN